VEDVELTRIFFEDLGKCKLFDGPPSVVGRVQRDMLGGFVFIGLFDIQETFSICASL
jgi:hypothetical protein